MLPRFKYMLSYTPLSDRESQAMRGVAMVCIMLHNILYKLLKVSVNEFYFEYNRVELFTNSIEAHPQYVAADALSFLGWYGVAVFMFLSGYGLVRKYEYTDRPLPIVPFVANRWLKLFKMIILPMIIFIGVRWGFESISYLLHDIACPQLTLLGNILTPYPHMLSIYWFFGITFQLYIFYRLLVYRCSTTWIVLLNVLGFVLFTWVWLYEDLQTLAVVRLNCVGWILPLTLGVLFARYDFSYIFSKRWVMIAVVLLSGVVLTAMNYNPYVWYFSPIVAIIASLFLAKLWQWQWWKVGILSSSIFVIHPIVRYLIIMNPKVLDFFGYNPASPHTINSIVITAIYAVIVFCVAMLYKRLYDYLFERKVR